MTKQEAQEVVDRAVIVAEVALDTPQDSQNTVALLATLVGIQASILRELVDMNEVLRRHDQED